MVKLPKRKQIGDKVYKPAVLIVRLRNEDGTPSLMEHVRDDDHSDVDDPDKPPQYLVAYLPQEVAEP